MSHQITGNLSFKVYDHNCMDGSINIWDQNSLEGRCRRLFFLSSPTFSFFCCMEESAEKTLCGCLFGVAHIWRPIYRQCLLPVLMNRRCGGAFQSPVDFTVAWNQNKEASIRLLFQGEQSLFGGLAGMPGGSVGRSHGSDASLISIEQASIPDIIFCRG